MSCVGRRQDARPDACQRGSQLGEWRVSIWQGTYGNVLVKDETELTSYVEFC